MARNRNDLSNPANIQLATEAEWILDPLGCAMREGQRVAGFGPLSREKVDLYKPTTSAHPQTGAPVPLMVHRQKMNTDRAYREAYYRSLQARHRAAERLKRPGEECGYELPAGECSRPVSCRFPFCLGRGAHELTMER